MWDPFHAIGHPVCLPLYFLTFTLAVHVLNRNASGCIDGRRGSLPPGIGFDMNLLSTGTDPTGKLWEIPCLILNVIIGAETCLDSPKMVAGIGERGGT